MSSKNEGEREQCSSTCDKIGSCCKLFELLSYVIGGIVQQLSFGVLHLLKEGIFIKQRTILVAIILRRIHRQFKLTLYLSFTSLFYITTSLFFTSTLFHLTHILIISTMAQFGWLNLQNQQQQHLEQINTIAYRMKQTGQEMNRQLQRQHQINSRLGREMDGTVGRMEGLQGQLGELLQTQDVNQVCTVGILCCLVFVLVLLILIF